jgi:hypothetical protein
MPRNGQIINIITTLPQFIKPQGTIKQRENALPHVWIYWVQPQPDPSFDIFNQFDEDDGNGGNGGYGGSGGGGKDNDYIPDNMKYLYEEFDNDTEWY